MGVASGFIPATSLKFFCLVCVAKMSELFSQGVGRLIYSGTHKREHSRKPDEQYDIIESCSWGPYLELFGRGYREGWTVWGNQASEDYRPT